MSQLRTLPRPVAEPVVAPPTVAGFPSQGLGRAISAAKVRAEEEFPTEASAIRFVKEVFSSPSSTRLSLRGQHLRVALVAITVRLALAALRLNPHNRKLRLRTVLRYVRLLERGRWQLNGETLGFDDEWRLINGQHRVFAVILTSVELTTLVVAGVERRAFTTFDQGESRILADALAVRGRKSASKEAGVLRLLNIYCRGNYPHENTEKLEVYDGDKLVDLLGAEALEESVAYGRKFETSGFLGAAVAGMFHFVLTKVDPQEASNFLEALRTGENLRDGDPVYVLRELFRADKDKRSRRSRPDKIYAMHQAWNMKRLGESVYWNRKKKVDSHFRWEPGMVVPPLHGAEFVKADLDAKIEEALSGRE